MAKRVVERSFNIEEDDMITASVCVISYLDKNGATMYAISADGDSTISTYAGLLEIGKHSFIHDAEAMFHRQEEEGDGGE